MALEKASSTVKFDDEQRRVPTCTHEIISQSALLREVNNIICAGVDNNTFKAYVIHQDHILSSVFQRVSNFPVSMKE